jgi:hypothetical protein
MKTTQMGSCMLLAMLALLITASQRLNAQQQSQQPALKLTFVPLGNGANALLMESPQPSPNNRFRAIQTHPDHNNNFNYFLLRELAARGYRALAVNLRAGERSRRVPAGARRRSEIRAQRARRRKSHLCDA